MTEQEAEDMGRVPVGEDGLDPRKSGSCPPNFAQLALPKILGRENKTKGNTLEFYKVHFPFNPGTLGNQKRAKICL